MRSLRFPRIAMAPVFAIGLALGLSDEPVRAGEAASPSRVAFEAGKAHRRAGAVREALVELRRASQLVGADRELAIRIHYELARTSIDRREFAQAMTECRVLGLKPGGKALGHACAAEANLLRRRASEALEEIKRAQALEPRLYEAKVAEGRARLLELRDKDAEALLREAITLAGSQPATEAWLALADLHALFGRTEAALADSREALKADGGSPDARYRIGRLLPPGPEALSHLEAALVGRPSFGEALARLAEVQIALGQLEAARGSAQRALKGDPSDASMRVVVGRVALAEGKADVAQLEAKAALSILPNLAAAKLLAADAYVKQREIDLAIESYQVAFGLDRSDPAPLIRASDACRAQGRETTARAFAERATRDFPEWAPAWVALGDAFVAQKDAAQAKAAYEQALKVKGLSDAADVRRRIEKLTVSAK